MAEPHWIAQAIAHPGYLTRFAREHGTLREDGTIDVPATLAAARKAGNVHAVRATNLLRTLQRLH